MEQALLENSIVLKDEDQVSPSRDAVLEGDNQVEIRRSCQVVIYADGKSPDGDRTGGTVEDGPARGGRHRGQDGYPELM